MIRRPPRSPLFPYPTLSRSLARGHGIKANRLLAVLSALGAHAGSHAQLFKPQRAVAAAIEMNLVVVNRLEPQRLQREMFQRLKHFRAALKKDFLVVSIDVGDDFGGIGGLSPCRGGDGLHAPT